MKVKAPLIYPMLVVDAGNTCIKFARVARQGSPPRIFETTATNHLTPARVARLWRQSKCRSATAACVVPAAAKKLRAGCPGIALIGPGTPLNFPALVDRRTIGADRLANMAEAARRFGKSVTVVDFGTAATFDVLDGRGRFAGGAIAPGIRILATALAHRTAQLSVAKLSPPRHAIGRNTREALQLGVAGGYAGLMMHLLKNFRSRHVIFTGGDARIAAGLTRLNPSIDPLWTLKGIATLGDSAVRNP